MATLGKERESVRERKKEGEGGRERGRGKEGGRERDKSMFFVVLALKMS